MQACKAGARLPPTVRQVCRLDARRRYGQRLRKTGSHHHTRQHGLTRRAFRARTSLRCRRTASLWPPHVAMHRRPGLPILRGSLFALAVLVAWAPPATGQDVGATPAEDATQALVKQYCVGCHNDRLKRGDLVLSGLDPARPTADPATWEKVARKVRAGMMPPAGAKRPDKPQLEAFASHLEAAIDRAAAAAPNPGRPALHRLNRIEYTNSVRDLLGFEIDAASLLPPDDMSHGFDNIADSLTLSPTLMESYIARRRRDHPAGRRRSRDFAAGRRPTGCRRRSLRTITSTVRRSARAGRRRPPLLSGRRRVRLRHVVLPLQRQDLRGAAGARADRGVGRRRARGAAGHQPADGCHRRAEDPAGQDQGRAAAGVGGVHQAAAGSGAGLRRCRSRTR